MGRLEEKASMVSQSSQPNSQRELTSTAVFQYNFSVPNDSENKTYLVMWDYSTGLVRITPFFKACKHSKVSTAYCVLSIVDELY